MRFFLDVEFTAFRDPKMAKRGLPYSPTARMLSLALIPEDDGPELYVEITDPKAIAKASVFVKDVVLTQFGLHPAVLAESGAAAGRAVAEFLSKVEGDLVVCADFDDDINFVVEALTESGRMAELKARLHFENVASLVSPNEKNESWASAFDAIEAGSILQRHHALVDALALKQVFQQLQ